MHHRLATLAIALACFSGTATAGLITQTLDFSFGSFTESGSPATPGPFSTVSGTVVMTYDDAITASVTGVAVDGITFTSPLATFDTSDVFFDIRLGPDRLFASNAWEMSIYHNEEGVFLGQTDDFLISMGGITVLGADFTSGVAAQGYHSASGGGFFFSNDTVISGTSATAASGVPSPATAALMLAGLALTGWPLARRRRRLT